MVLGTWCVIAYQAYGPCVRGQFSSNIWRHDMAQRLGRSTLSVSSPEWDGVAFANADAQKFWLMLPRELQEIAVAEMSQGNQPASILHNEERGIALLALSSRPRTASPESGAIRVHRKHEYGNYCYDGTLCTYEHLKSGCFLAFHDPDYRES